MNKDKIIKDLKERNDKLANQYRLRDIRCVHLELVNEKLEQENKQLEDLLHKANDEVISYTNCCIDLKEKIDKAIEYLKTFHFIDNIRVLDVKEYKKLLEILEGKE